MAAQDLRIRISADGSAAIVGMRRVQEELGRTGRSADELNGGFGRIAAGLKGLALTAAAGMGVAELARGFITAATESQRFQASLTAITGSTQAAGAEMEYIRATADKMGLKLGDVATAWISLSAAAKGSALEGQAARDIFESVSLAMGKLGKSSADTQGALLAIEQMISKGVVSAEELRGQLGERLPGAFKAAADAMGRTEQELGKMLESGEVMAEELLPLLSQRLNELYNDGKEIGGLAPEWNRLTNALSDMAVEADRATGATNLLADALRQAKSLADVFGQAFTAIQNARAGLGLQNFASDADKFNATMGVMLEKQREFQMLSARVAANQDSLFLGQYEAQLRRAGEELGVWTQKVAGMQSVQVAAAKSARELANQQAAMVGDDMVKRWEEHTAAVEGHRASVDKIVGSYDKLKDREIKVKEKEKELAEAVKAKVITEKEAKDILDKYAASLDKSTTAKGGAAKASKALAAADREGAKAVAEAERAVQSLIDRYLPARAAAEDHARAQAAVAAALAGQAGSVALSAAEAEKIMGELTKEQAAAAEAARRESDAFYNAWAEAVDSLDDTFQSLWRGLITGQGDVLGNLKETVLEWVADLSYQLLLSPLIVPIQGALMGLMGGGAGGVTGTATSLLGGASSLSNMFSTGSTLYNAASSLFSGAAFSGISQGFTLAMENIGIGGYFGSFGTNMALAGSSASTGAMGTAIGAALPYAIPAAIAVAAAVAIFSKWQSDQEPRYGTLAAMTGGRSRGLEDAEWGAASGAYVKGSFGLNFGLTDKGSKNMDATELTEVYQALADVSDALAEFFGDDLSSFIEAELQKMSDFGDGLIHLTENEGDLGGAMAALVERIALAAGRSAEDIGIAFGAMVGDLSGTAEEVGEQIQAAMVASALAVELSDRYDDDLGQMLELTGDITDDVKRLKGYVDEFGSSGENSAATLTRLVTQLGLLDTAAKQTATDLEGLSAKALIELSDDIVAAFGSLDAASQAMAFYYQEFTTQTEKLVDAIQAAAKQINTAVPQLQDELIKLSQDVTTTITKAVEETGDSGKELRDSLGKILGDRVRAVFEVPVDDTSAYTGDAARWATSMQNWIKNQGVSPMLYLQISAGLEQYADALRSLGYEVDRGTKVFLDSLGKLKKPVADGGQTITETITTPGDPNAAILAKLLDDLPKTRQGFDDLIGSIKLTTEAGRKLHAGLLELAPQFDLLYDGVEAFTDWLLGVDEVSAATRELERVFSDWGLTLPENRDALRDLYDSGVLSAEQMAILAAYLKELGLVFGDLAKSPVGNPDAPGVDANLAEKAQAAYDALVRAADAERERINAAFEARVDALNAEREAITEAGAARLAALSTEREAAQAALAAAKSSLSSIQAAISSLRGAIGVDEFSRVRAQRQLAAWASARTLPGQEALDKVLPSATAFNPDDYANEAAYRAAQGGTLANLLVLEQLGLDQVSVEERTLAAIENQTKAVEAATKAQLAAIQRQIDAAGVWRDTQLTKLDEMVAAAKKQLDAALGTQEATLSLTEAVKQFNDAIKAIDPQATPLALATVSTTVQAASASLTTTLSSQTVQQTAAAAQSNAQLAALRAEIASLRADLAASNTASVAALKSVDNRLQRWDLDGLPAGADAGGDSYVLRVA